MARVIQLTVAALLAALGNAAGAAPQLSVVFVNPESFRDAAYSRPHATPADVAAVEHDLERHLQGLVDRGLPAGESLRVEVLDIDLAGGFNPFWPASSYLRIVSEIYWPSITLRYTLSRGDQVIASAEERIDDKTYLMTVNPYSSEDRFRYEKPMLDGWFGRRFGSMSSGEASVAGK